jgi:O-acetyl-ADP-ribose deacetylase (regulator of RNase III)
LLDTGADLNIIKLDSLSDEVIVNVDDTYELQGIHENLVSTMGSVLLDIQIGNSTKQVQFQVVPTTFPIPQDGIMGRPLLEQLKAVINCEKGTLTSDVSENEINVPARSHVVIPVSTKNVTGDNRDVLVHSQQLADGLYCGNVLNTVENGHILICIANSQEEPRQIPTPRLEDLSYQIYSDTDIKSIFSARRAENRQNRIKLLEKSLRLDHANIEERKSVENICYEYADIFHVEGDTISCTDAIQHEIKTPGVSQPIHQRPYRLPYSQQAEIDKQVNELLEDGVIAASDSPWNAPLLIVPKKVDATGEQRYRVVVDYRKLNSITVGDAFPMPNINEILDQLGRAKYFSCLDMASGYHQVPLCPKDQEKTAFSTNQGHFEFKRMSFGLKGAPSTFQRLVNRVLMGINGFRAFVYLDDIIIIATSVQEHEERLREVFDRLRQYNLKLQPAKCEFMRREVNYLGHIISEDGIRPDPKKTACLTNFPVPRNPKEVKSFLGLAGYYRKFVKDFSQISKPLTSLLKKEARFEWSDMCQNSFEQLKEILTTEPLLQHPDFTQPFLITTDASNSAIGAVLSQGRVGSDLPISYISRTLNQAEVNYNTTEKELLAIVWAVKQFRHYVFGHKFYIITDHRPLTWLFSVSDPGARLIRWRLKLEEHDYEIIYKPGVLNTNADALSRIPHVNYFNYQESAYKDFMDTDRPVINNRVIEVEGDLFDATQDYALAHCVSADFEMSQGIALEFKRRFGQVENLKSQNKKVTEIAKIEHEGQQLLYLVTKESFDQKPTYETIFKTIQNLRRTAEQELITHIAMPHISCGRDKLDWNKVKPMIKYIFKGSRIKIVIYSDQIYSPEEKMQIISEFHNGILGGHQGISRTVKRIKMHHSWKGMKADVIDFIKKCSSCQVHKASNHTVKQPMVITTTAKTPFEKIFMDIVGPITTSYRNNSYILTIQDDLTKYSLAIPIPKHDANTIAKEFVEKFVCFHGAPKSIVSDQGADFLSKVFSACCKLLKIEKLHTTAYHPQSDGALERSHRTLSEYLRHFVDKNLQNWDDYVPFAMFVYNTTPHTTTDRQPYELLYGRPAEVPNSLSRTEEVRYNYDDYCSELKQRLQQAHDIARQTIVKKKVKSKTIYDRTAKPITVHVGDKVLTKWHTKKGKLSANWQGPFTVVGRTDTENIIIKKGRREVKTHINEVKLFQE